MNRIIKYFTNDKIPLLERVNTFLTFAIPVLIAIAILDGLGVI